MTAATGVAARVRDSLPGYSDRDGNAGAIRTSRDITSSRPLRVPEQIEAGCERRGRRD
jgi:hypothetical protein